MASHDHLCTWVTYKCFQSICLGDFPSMQRGGLVECGTDLASIVGYIFAHLKRLPRNLQYVNGYLPYLEGSTWADCLTTPGKPGAAQMMAPLPLFAPLFLSPDIFLILCSVPRVSYSPTYGYKCEIVAGNPTMWHAERRGTP